jgi:hypothetical protein
MAQATLVRVRRPSLVHRLSRLGHWLLDAAAASLGFSAPEDHPAPPPIGVQPYSGGRRHQGRHQRFWL